MEKVTNAKPIRPLLWCIARTLPAVYDSGLSNIEILSKVLAAVNDLIKNNNEFIKELNEAEVNILQLQADVAQLQQDIEDVKNGEYVSLYLNSIISWIDTNLQCLVARVVKFFSFGIDDTGHVYVDIPYTWRFLDISWDMNYGTENFGHIIMEW